MPAHRAVAAAAPDGRSHALAFKISGGNGGSASPYWWCSQVEFNLGAEPGTCVLNIATRPGRVDEASGTLACVPGGFASQVKIGDRVQVYRVWKDGERWARKRVFHAKVLTPAHVLAPEGFSVKCVDARHDLRARRIIGRHIYNPDASGDDTKEGFQQGERAHFNPGGRPNCIYNEKGKPRFAVNPDFGLTTNENPPAPSEKHGSKASYWTLAGMLDYLREFHGPDYVHPEAVLDRWPWLAAHNCPSYLRWPASLGSAVDTESQANFNDAADQGNQNVGNARKGRELDTFGRSLFDVLNAILESAGPYALGIEFGDDADTLACVRTSFDSAKNGVSLPLARNGSPPAYAAVTGGMLEYEGENLVTQIAGSAQRVLVERLGSTKDTPAEAYALRWPMDSSRWDAFRTAVVTFGNTREAWDKARRLYPEISFWGYRAAFNAGLDTDWANYPRAEVPRTVLPTQLTPVPNAGNDFAGLRYPVWVEVELTPGTWQLAGYFDGFETLDNGLFNLPALMDLGSSVQAFKDNGTAVSPAIFSVSGGKIDISMRNIRMNLVLPLDVRLSDAYKIGSDPTANVQVGLNSPAVELVAKDYVHPCFMDLRSLYARWDYINSYAIPPTAGGTVAAGPGPLRYDGPYLASHLKRALKRMTENILHGTLDIEGYLCDTFPIGTQLAALEPTGGGAPFPLRTVVTGLRMLSRPANQGGNLTQVIVGSVPDVSV